LGKNWEYKLAGTWTKRPGDGAGRTWGLSGAPKRVPQGVFTISVALSRPLYSYRPVAPARARRPEWRGPRPIKGGGPGSFPCTPRKIRPAPGGDRRGDRPRDCKQPNHPHPAVLANFFFRRSRTGNRFGNGGGPLGKPCLAAGQGGPAVWWRLTPAEKKGGGGLRGGLCTSVKLGGKRGAAGQRAVRTGFYGIRGERFSLGFSPLRRKEVSERNKGR